MNMRWMVWMVGPNLEARGLYIPQAGEPRTIPLLIPSLFSAARELRDLR
jgi:hypothetical protein